MLWKKKRGKSFPSIRKIMNTESLEQLGQELEAAKNKEVRKAS